MIQAKANDETPILSGYLLFKRPDAENYFNTIIYRQVDKSCQKHSFTISDECHRKGKVGKRVLVWGLFFNV